MNRRYIFLPFFLVFAGEIAAGAAIAQDKGSINPKPLPPLANPKDPTIGARELFARKVLPTAMPTRAIGFYSHGCIAARRRCQSTERPGRRCGCRVIETGDIRISSRW